MSKLITWMKSNPISVVSIVIIVLSLVAFIYPIYTEGSEFREEMASRGSEINKINSLKSTSVQLPPARPDGPPQRFNIVVNEAAINQLDTIYGRLREEYNGLFNEAVAFNRDSHQPMLSTLFPSPRSAGTPFEAQQAYLRSFEELYMTLDAGEAPSQQEAQQELRIIDEAFRGSVYPPMTNLTEEQQQELLSKQTQGLLDFYRKAAEKVHVYAAPNIFQIDQWARNPGRPDIFDIWNSQVALWIQQDMAKAVALANGVNDPNMSVLDAPVKQILSLSVEPDYVGIPDQGLQGEQEQTADEKLRDNFASSPTGRVSNALYDVRHAKMSVVIDSKRIPELLNALSQANFMTVIGMNMQDVDEYAALQQGYYYGVGDMVQLDLTIETVWLREWLAGDPTEQMGEPNFNPGLMPDVVRWYLGMAPRDENFQPPARFEGDSPMMMDGMMPGMMPGMY